MYLTLIMCATVTASGTDTKVTPIKIGRLFDHGIVVAILKDKSFSLASKSGRTRTFTPSMNLKQGIDDGRERLFKSRLKDLRVGQFINILYGPDPTSPALICTYLRILREPDE